LLNVYYPAPATSSISLGSFVEECLIGTYSNNKQNSMQALLQSYPSSAGSKYLLPSDWNLMESAIQACMNTPGVSSVEGNWDSGSLELTTLGSMPPVVVGVTVSSAPISSGSPGSVTVSNVDDVGDLVPEPDDDTDLLDLVTF
jgi:hypothetical protein